jgi:hypothetical protein
MSQKSNKKEMLLRAYELAYFLYGDKRCAMNVAIDAMDYIEAAANRQDKRFHYSGKRRYKVSFTDLQLLQWLVYLSSDSYEKKCEAESSYQKSEERMLTHFIKYLVLITTRLNSFHVSLGVSRILCDYTTPESSDIYNVVVQDPDRVPDDSYSRARKKALMDQIKKRFGDLLVLVRGKYGEERFFSPGNLEEQVDLVQECLRRFIPWGTDHVIPDGYDPMRCELMGLAFVESDPDTEHLTEISRMHAVLDPNCFERLTAGLGFEPPLKRFSVPHFFASQTGVDNSKSSVSLR